MLERKIKIQKGKIFDKKEMWEKRICVKCKQIEMKVQKKSSKLFIKKSKTKIKLCQKSYRNTEVYKNMNKEKKTCY